MLRQLVVQYNLIDLYTNVLIVYIMYQLFDVYTKLLIVILIYLIAMFKYDYRDRIGFNSCFNIAF